MAFTKWRLLRRDSRRFTEVGSPLPQEELPQEEKPNSKRSDYSSSLICLSILAFAMLLSGSLLSLLVGNDDDDSPTFTEAPTVVPTPSIITHITEAPTVAPTPNIITNTTESPTVILSPQPTSVTNVPTATSSFLTNTTNTQTAPPTLQSPRPSTTTTNGSAPTPALRNSESCSVNASCINCEGACFEDTDCKEGLACFRREGFTLVPGCAGYGVDGMNYCFVPQNPILGHRGNCTKDAPCGFCEGDCDDHDDCGPGLYCFQRTEYEPVPGCGGFGSYGQDYCYEAPTLPNVLTNIGDCTIAQPCGECEGNCFQDANCQGNLVCFRRSGNEAVPGCVTGGSGDLSSTNYCHRPLSEGPVTYIPGDLTVNENGLLLSTGLTSRIIAETGKPVQYGVGGESSVLFHTRPDGAGVVETSDGGWIYTSNSEASPGGVGAVRFDRLGNVVDYQMIATETNFNCGGGLTWWNTWLTCEEVSGGSVWETDPFGINKEKVTLLGGSGGRFESAAYYRPNTLNPTFYVTEDMENGALRRFTPDTGALAIANVLNDFSELLHSNSTGSAKIEFLQLIPARDTNDTGVFHWTTDESTAREDAVSYYSFSEGIDISRGILYLTAKAPKMLLALDLESGTWNRSSTENGAFSNQPDQIMSILGDDSDGGDDILYFCEDGGFNSGVHGRNLSGLFYNILNGPAYETETTGLAFSPDKRHLLVSFQEPGIIFDITRLDGYPFGGTRLDIKYSKAKS